MVASTPKSYSADPTLWLYTSLSSGSSQIVTATSRLETILKANRIPFQALDVATDEKARMLWGRRAGKRKLPGLVRMGMVIGDLEEVEEWNEYGEIQENLLFDSEPVGPAPIITPQGSAASTPSKSAPLAPPMPDTSAKAAPSPLSKFTSSKPETSSATTPKSPPAEEKPSLAGQMRNMGAEAAEKAKQMRSAKLKAMAAGVSTSKPGEKKEEEPAKETEATTESKEVPEATVDTTKLDNSAPTGVPPPTGETSAEDAKAPETGDASVVSKTDEVPATSTEGETPTEAAADAKGSESPLLSAEKPTDEVSPESLNSTAVESTSDLPATAHTPTHHRGSSLSMASKEKIKEVEEATKIPEAEEEEAEDEAVEEPKEKELPTTTKLPLRPKSAIKTEEKSEEGHVKFGGEAQGNELDRVKATLERSSPGHSPKPSVTSPSAAAPAESKDETTKDGPKPVEDTESTKDEVKSVATTDKGEDLPGTKTQSQEAADPSKAGESVAD